MFEPEINNYKIAQLDVVDLAGKSFYHNEERTARNINLVAENYPKLKYLLEKLHIFFCPVPATDTANACASDDYICLYARGTQIPWCMTDYIVAHELGHVVQFNLCKTRGNKFREYLELRKAEKGMCYDIYDYYDDKNKKNIYVDKEDFLYLNGNTEEKNKYKDWDTNPIEWFAEDFRYLFGIDQGDKFWGFNIPEPDEKIKEFILNL
jgi:hypothetical protein